MIELDTLRALNYVIEHDKVSSTYKYALLKSAIQVSQRYEHLTIFENEKVHLPLGLIVEQWLLDYLPFICKSIRQQNNGQVLNKKIEENYKRFFTSMNLDCESDWKYSYYVLIEQIENASTKTISETLLNLSREIAHTITNMPMRYIGRREYELFMPEYTSFGRIKPKKEKVFSRDFLIHNFGTFTVSVSLYQVFRHLGESLIGTATIISKWREKTLALNPEMQWNDDIFSSLMHSIADQRDTTQIRSLLNGTQECVWSAKELNGNQYDIDHVLPYALWGNNDMWNLLPADKKVNNTKRDKVPEPELIKKRSDVIIKYWEKYSSLMPVKFERQMQISLGEYNDMSQAIESLCNKCHYLIYDRGHIGFNIY